MSGAVSASGVPRKAGKRRGRSLASRLTLAFALTSAIPLLLVLPVASRFAGHTYEERLRAELNAARLRVVDLLEGQGDKVKGDLDALMKDPRMLDQLVDPSRLLRLLSEARRPGELPDVLSRSGLEALFVVGPDGHYLANSLQIGNDGLVPPELRAAYDRALTSPVRRLESGPGGEPALLVLSSAQLGDRLVVGGERVDEAFLRRLREEHQMAFVLAPGAAPPFDGAITAGVPVADPALRSPEALSAAFLSQVVPVPVDGGRPFTIHVLKGREELEAVRRRIIGLFAGLFALAFLIAGVTGYALAQRITRPVGRLVDAFAAFAVGNDVRVDLQEGPQELVRMGEAFNRMAADLRDNEQKLLRAERIAAWEEIARRLAHEIKNPLSPIRLAIENCRKAYDRKLPEFDEIFREASQAVLEEVEKLRRIVEEFSQFARLPKPVMTSQELNDTVKNAIRLHASPGRGVRIDVALDPSLPPFLFDADQIHRVLVNLIQNAIDASPEGGTVTVQTRPEPAGAPWPAKAPQAGEDKPWPAKAPQAGEDKPWAVLAVTDRGMGIAPDVKERLFLPYVTTKSHGTGLGLAISARIVEEHGGTIEAAPAFPGTTFSVTLPLRIGAGGGATRRDAAIP